ncbi:hypothetical protein ACFU9B_37670 [Streptomyces sp. NPDC057592]|uniref:hypothetical protein n=1 Tax=unclassified Streptomyces TaxID=2593676 RepID=UPI0036B5695B
MNKNEAREAPASADALASQIRRGTLAQDVPHRSYVPDSRDAFASYMELTAGERLSLP